MILETLIDTPQFSLPQCEKERVLLEGLSGLVDYHRARCPEYARILDRLRWTGRKTQELGDIPFLPVSLFKSHYLKSIPDGNVSMVMTSSGTTGQQVSHIAIDPSSSVLQARALGKVFAHLVGPKRLPMLIIDSKAVIHNPKLLSARGAGVLGLMRFGRDHAFALDEAQQPDRESVLRFLQRVGGQPFVIFGFTFMVWQHLYRAFGGAGLALSQGILLHSGGWKTLQESAVDNAIFRASLKKAFGLTRIHNLYGMVEQMGVVHVEASDGNLYSPNFADIIVRNTRTWEPAAVGEIGVIQTLSLLPRSYPGHSVLTEDLGVIKSVDAGVDGRYGKAFQVVGRVPHVELRGCSDTHAEDVAQRQTKVPEQ
jgi:hypothetical protein